MIPVENNQAFVVCESCGNRYDVPLDEKKEQFLNLYSRADDAWDHKDFEEASELYQQILNQDNSQSEAHFGLVLCKYGITYETDPVTGKKMPNCNRINRDSILDDKHYQAALKYASPEAAANFKDRAQVIDRISRDFLKIVDKEPPYDVFISYKRTDETGNLTQDSKIARKLYYHLTEKGFKVFFAEVTLNNMAGEKYEPYIFAALSSAPVMVLLGSKRDHFDATWVKNEWRRYLVLMSQGLKKTLIPAYYEMDPYHLPGELRNLQAVNAAEITFQEDLTEIIRKKVADAKDGTQSTTETKTVSLKDKYATKEKIDAVVKATDCERDTAINVLIQNYGDVKKTITFIEGDPDYKKSLWLCTECGTANTHDVCRQCGVTKKESIEVAKERAKAKEKAARETAAYKAAKKQKAKKTVKTIIIIGVILAVLIGLYALGKQLAIVDAESLAGVAIVIGFIIGIILFFILGAPGGFIGFGISAGLCAAIICGILFGFRALFISNVDDLYTPEIVQTYTGSYEDKGTAYVTISECDDNGSLKGTFIYTNKDSQVGQFDFTGQITKKKSNGVLELSITPTAWTIQAGKDELPGTMNIEVTEKYTKLYCTNPALTLRSGSDEYSLKTAEDLKRLSGTSGTFTLANDIDLSGAEWKPLEGFTGTLLGNGHVIKGMTIKADSDNVGFFSTLSGTVINLHFQEANVTVSGRRENVGILCGKLENVKLEDKTVKTGTVNNVSADGTVTATTGTNVGGIIGKIEINNSFALVNLNNKANVSGLTKVGGVVGNIEKEVENANTATLTKLSNTGNITASTDYAAGIVGYMRQVTSSGYSAIVITASELTNNATIKGESYVGGIFGHLYSDSKDSTLQDATSSGTIDAKCFAGCIGGRLDTITLRNCTNEGSSLNVSGYLTDNGEKFAYAGGIAGYGYAANNCTNTVSINYTGTGRYVGGIFGYAKFDNDQTLADLTNNADIYGYSYVGGIFGALESESSDNRTITLSNFKNTGAITGQSLYTGGIMGYTKHSTSSGYSAHTVAISDFTNTGAITGTGYTGGIFGNVQTDSKDSTMQDCSNASNVTGEYYVGCIAGQALFITVNDCANVGSTLTATGSTTVEGEKYAYVGGFVGNGFAANNCTNEVEINYTGNGRYVGGIMGCINRGDNENSVSNYEMSGLKNNAAITSNGSFVGGIFGCLRHEDNGDNTVELKAFENNAAIKGYNYTGGIVGCLEAFTSSSYHSITLYAYNFVNTGNISGNSNTGGIFGYGKTDSDNSAIIDAQTGSYGNLEKIKKS